MSTLLLHYLYSATQKLKHGRHTLGTRMLPVSVASLQPNADEVKANVTWGE
jgi:hypothetical protein